jgi:hypothetical protein
MPSVPPVALLILPLLALAACNRDPLLVERSPCPAVGIPVHVGSYTRFDPPESRNADAIDFVAQLTDLSASCTPGDTMLVSDVGFTVTAIRRQPGPAREVVLPIFVSLVQGGNVLVSKQLTAVSLRFPEGGLRAQARGGHAAARHPAPDHPAAAPARRGCAHRPDV